MKYGVRKPNIKVAPLVEAWIEITTSSGMLKSKESLLSWKRGLKYVVPFHLLPDISSLLSWKRGLKYSCWRMFESVYHVAPLVEAWIEIVLRSPL